MRVRLLLPLYGGLRSTYTSPPQPRQQQPRSREQQRDAGAAFQTPREFSEDEVREAFNAFDTDGDGFLTCDDVMLFFEALGVRAEHTRLSKGHWGRARSPIFQETLTRLEVQEMMAMVDTRGMGYIDFVQFFELATRSAGYFAK